MFENLIEQSSHVSLFQLRPCVLNLSHPKVILVFGAGHVTRITIYFTFLTDSLVHSQLFTQLILQILSSHFLCQQLNYFKYPFLFQVNMHNSTAFYKTIQEALMKTLHSYIEVNENYFLAFEKSLHHCT